MIIRSSGFTLNILNVCNFLVAFYQCHPDFPWMDIEHWKICQICQRTYSTFNKSKFFAASLYINYKKKMCVDQIA